jgi:hypothetical protein
MKKCSTILLAVLAFAATARAERPPQVREEARLIVSGTVQKITVETFPFGNDGLRSDYTANVLIDAVQKGKQVKPQQTLAVSWFQITKRPTQPMPGAYGHRYTIKAKDRATFWLMTQNPGGSWALIYSPQGIEKLK